LEQLWYYNWPSWAGKFLDEWCRQTMRSGIEPMKKMLDLFASTGN
jgi:transposase